LRQARLFLTCGGLKKIVRPEISRKAIYRPLGEIMARRRVKMAILAVPAAAAQQVANTLIQIGITGILNFAPLVLHVPPEVMVNTVNLAIKLENLSCFVQR